MDTYKDFEILLYTVIGDRPSLTPMRDVVQGTNRLLIDDETIYDLNSSLENKGFQYVNDGRFEGNLDFPHWENWFSDISACFPNILFQINWLQDINNMGVAYFLNGKAQYGYALIQYEPFVLEYL